MTHTANTIAKSIGISLLLTLLSVVFVPTVYAENLVVNGDFSNGFTGWTKRGTTSRLDIYPSSWCGPHYNSGNPAAGFNVYGTTAVLEQEIELPDGGPYKLEFREWGQYQATTVKVIIYDEADTPYQLDSFTAERMIQSYSGNPPVFQCTTNTPKLKSYDISDFAGEIIVIHIEASSSGFDGTFALIDDVTIEGKRGVQGKVSYRPEKPGEAVEGVTIRLTGTTTGGQAVSQETKTDSNGEYSFDVDKGDYAVEATGDGIYKEKDGAIKNENGGVLSAESAEGGDCGGTASKNTCKVKLEGSSAKADFSYTLCATDEKKPNGKPLTHCPVILVPGFLGSTIQCQGRSLWPGIPLPGWHVMLLNDDGVTNRQDNGDCNAVAEPGKGEAGVVDKVVVLDVYKGALEFLKDQYPDRWRASPYDWRKSPVFGADILKQTVDEVLETTKSKHVVLFGHSMGGLVIREYLNNNADKISRIVTAGTPYWGAPKSHFALLGGYTDTPEGSPLDYPTIAADLQLLARNLQGLFFLYPSANLGSWLSVSPAPGKPAKLQGPSGEIEWVASLGATPALLNNARSWHAQNDTFPQTDIDYRVVVGAGSATTIETRVFVSPDPNILDPGRLSAFGHIIVGDGDSTVPIRSATQGASDGGASPVPIYYACGVSHVALPVNPNVLNGIRSFLTGGEDITGMDAKCPFAGTQLLMYDIDIGGGNQVNVNPEGFQSAQLSTRALQSTSMSLDDAVKQGVVQYITIGRSTIILTDDAKPVSITISGKPIAFQTQRFSSDGAGEMLSFKPAKGPVVIGASGQVIAAAGSKLTPIKGSGKAPKTTANLTNKGGNVSVRLTAKGATGVGGTYYQIGSGGVKKYKKAFKVKSGKKPVKVSFYSVDPFGVSEKPKKVTIGKK